MPHHHHIFTLTIYGVVLYLYQKTTIEWGSVASGGFPICSIEGLLLLTSFLILLNKSKKVEKV